MMLTIGELSQRANLSVRALHHYDAIGLLKPRVRTDAGARRYGPDDVVRLHRIQAMKQLGYALADIKLALDDSALNPGDLLRSQIEDAQRKAAQAHALANSLQQLLVQLTQGESPLPDDWLNSLEMMALYQKHLSPAEVVALGKPRGQSMRKHEACWAQLVCDVQQTMERDGAQDSPTAQVLAWRWIHLVIDKTNNNATLVVKLRSMQLNEPRAQAIVGISQAMMEWIGGAMAHARTHLFARYLTPAQTAKLRERQLQSMAEDMDVWPRLLAKVQVALDAGTPSQAPQVQALAREWQDMFKASYCGDDTDMAARVRLAFAKEPDLRLGVGVNDSVLAYMREALEATS